MLDDDFIYDLYRLRLPPINEARAGWKFDHDAILAAMDELQLKFPVVLRFRHYKRQQNTGWRTFGKHGMRENHAMGIYHEIKINDALSWIRKIDDEDVTPGKISWILWHELKHAEQTERWAEHYGKSPFRFYYEAYHAHYAKGKWGATYSQNIYELDANEFADAKVGSLLVLKEN